MAEKETTTVEPRCMLCKATSNERVLLQAQDKGKDAWVCVKCLPMLIHGTPH